MTTQQKALHREKCKLYQHTHPDAQKRYYLRTYEKQKQRAEIDQQFRDKLIAKSRVTKMKIRSDPVKLARLNEKKRLSYHRNKKPSTEKRKLWNANYARKKRATDPQFRIRGVLTCRLRSALRGISKASHTEALVGCDWKSLVNHIEKQWLPGMSWDNYGLRKGCWSIDHIKPCAGFNLEDPVEQKICFHYSNLRPLWHYDNQSKGSLWNGVRHRYRKPDTSA